MNFTLNIKENESLNLTHLPFNVNVTEQNENSMPDEKDPKKYDILPESCNLNQTNNEEIPIMTIKKQSIINISKNEQQIVPIQILHIFFSEIISHNPYIYNFANQKYRFVFIFGTITNVINKNDNQLNIKVDDGTGCITCIINNFNDELIYRKKIRSLLQNSNKENRLHKTEMIKLTETMNFSKREDEFLYLRSVANIFLQKLNNELEQKSSCLELNIGDQISLVGNVSDYMNQRLIFVKHICREENDEEFFNHLFSTIKI